MRIVISGLLAVCLAGNVMLWSGCISTPPELVVTDDGQVVQMTTEQKLEHLEAQYQQAKATIEELQASAGFLPPGLDIAAISALAALSAGLERKRRKLRAEIKSEEPKTDAA